MANQGQGNIGFARLRNRLHIVGRKRLDNSYCREHITTGGTPGESTGILARSSYPRSRPISPRWKLSTGRGMAGTAEFGSFFSTRDLAKNVGGVAELIALQVSSRLDQAPAWGGGIEFEMPDGRTLFRGMIRGTLNGQASAQVALCKVLEGELCIPRKASSRHTTAHAEVIFVQGTREDAFRQNFILGLGLRSYQFTVEACDSSPNRNEDLFVLCDMVQEIYQNQAQVQGFVQFGFGFSYHSGPWSIAARINDMVGPYAGGSGRADGDFQNDVYLMGSVSYKVR